MDRITPQEYERHSAECLGPLWDGHSIGGCPLPRAAAEYTRECRGEGCGVSFPSTPDARPPYYCTECAEPTPCFVVHGEPFRIDPLERGTVPSSSDQCDSCGACSFIVGMGSHVGQLEVVCTECNTRYAIVYRPAAEVVW